MSRSRAHQPHPAAKAPASRPRRGPRSLPPVREIGVDWLGGSASHLARLHHQSERSSPSAPRPSMPTHWPQEITSPAKCLPSHPRTEDEFDPGCIPRSQKLVGASRWTRIGAATTSAGAWRVPPLALGDGCSGDIDQEDITNNAVRVWKGMPGFRFTLTDNPRESLHAPGGPKGPRSAHRHRERAEVALQLVLVVAHPLGRAGAPVDGYGRDSRIHMCMRLCGIMRFGGDT